MGAYGLCQLAVGRVKSPPICHRIFIGQHFSDYSFSFQFFFPLSMDFFFSPKKYLSIKLIKYLFLRAERLYSQPLFSQRLLRILHCGQKPPFRLFHSLGSQTKCILLHALERYLQTLFHMVYFFNCDKTFYE